MGSIRHASFAQPRAHNRVRVQAARERRGEGRLAPLHPGLVQAELGPLRAPGGRGWSQGLGPQESRVLAATSRREEGLEAPPDARGAQLPRVLVAEGPFEGSDLAIGPLFFCFQRSSYLQTTLVDQV